DIAGLGERGGIDDAEGNVEQPREGAGEEGLSRAGGTEEKDVGLFDVDAIEFTVLDAFLAEALVVVVNSHREDLFGLFLADHEIIETGAHFRRRHEGPGNLAGPAFLALAL